MGAKSAAKVNIKKTKKTNYLQSWRRKSQWRKNWKVNKLKRPFAVIMQGLCRKMRKRATNREEVVHLFIVGKMVFPGLRLMFPGSFFLTYTTHLLCGISSNNRKKRWGRGRSKFENVQFLAEAFGIYLRRK